MGQSGVSVDPEAIERIRKRVLKEEKAQLQYNRPPSINNDIEEIIREEISEASLDGN